MSEEVPKTIATTLKHFNLFKIFGIYPIRFNNGIFKAYKLFQPSYILSTLWVYAIFIFTIYYLIVSVERGSLRTWSKISLQIIRMMIATRFVMICATGRQSVAKLLNNFIDLDLRLKRYGLKTNFRVVRLSILIKICAIIAFTLTNWMTCTIHRNISECIQHLSAYHLVLIIMTFISLKFSIFTLMLWQRMRLINDVLTKMVIERRNPNFQSNSQDPTELLKFLGGIHFDLCNNAKLVNVVYGEQLLLTVMKSFIDILNGLHSVFTRSGFIAICFDLSWSFFVLLEIVFILIPSTSVTRSSRRTAEILNMLNLNGDEQLKFERDMFLLQMVHQNIKFTVNDFFPLDETVFVLIFGTAVSYLIILIQFESMAD